MGNARSTPPVPPDAISSILKTVGRSPRPLTVAKIQESLPTPFRPALPELAEILEEQIRRGEIFRWVPYRRVQRFWVHSPAPYAHERMLAALSYRPLSRSEIRAALKKTMFGCSDHKADDLARKTMARLRSEQMIFEHPPVGRLRAARYATRPPDPAPYLKKTLEAYEKARRQLKNSGLSEEQLFNALRNTLLPPTEITAPEGETAASPDAAEPSADLSERILKRMVEIKPSAADEALVWIPELRAAMNVPKRVFDDAILEMARRDTLILHRHAHSGRMDRAEREEMVTDGRGNYYVGVVWRSDE